MKKFNVLFLLCATAFFLCYACTDIDITMPKGAKGDAGLSAYEFWKEKVTDGTLEWPKDQVGIADYFKYIKGKDGTSDNEGQSAFEQWKEMIANGNVDDPHNPGQKWPAANNTVQDFWRFLTGATGESGQTPHIGTNGNWFIGSNDTGIAAQGKDAVSPTITIGSNGNWFIDGQDTEKTAFGKDGTDGKSAYELWKEYIASGNVYNPHKTEEKWPASKNLQSDFWEFLTGVATGVIIEAGKYNVIAQFWNAELKEYVSPRKGSVTFMVYDKTGKAVSSGVEVSGLPGVSATEVFTTNYAGQITVSWDKLPNFKTIEERMGSANVTINGVTETSAANTIVPNRVNIRGYVTHVIPDNYEYVQITVELQRQIDGKWSIYPPALSYPRRHTAKIIDVNEPVSDTNLDENYFINGSYSSILIKRPYVLTPEEDLNVSNNDTITRLKSNQWNHEENYAGIYLGDGEGIDDDYGQTIYLADKIHIPELYPAPGLVADSVFIDIKPGISVLWGQVDTDKLHDFYPHLYFIKGSTGIWKSPNGKQAPSELSPVRVIGIRMSTYINGAGGTTISTTNEMYTGAKRFKLTGAYANNWIQIGALYERQVYGDGSTSLYPYGEYRERYAYYLYQDSQTNEFYLVDFADRTKRIPVEQKDCPADWMQ